MCHHYPERSLPVVGRISEVDNVCCLYKPDGDLFYALNQLHCPKYPKRRIPISRMNLPIGHRTHAQAVPGEWLIIRAVRRPQPPGDPLYIVWLGRCLCVT